jgi:hypothetical protein
MQCAARDAMRGSLRRYRRGELVAVAKNKVFIKPLALACNRQKGSRLVAEEWVDRWVEEWVDGGMGGGMGGWRDGWTGGQREK